MRRRVLLWHPDSPGVRMIVSPCLLRRLRLIRSEFATIGEVLGEYARRDDHDAYRRSFGVAA